jgi:hypothetical protein
LQHQLYLGAFLRWQARKRSSGYFVVLAIVKVEVKGKATFLYNRTQQLTQRITGRGSAEEITEEAS